MNGAVRNISLKESEDLVHSDYSGFLFKFHICLFLHSPVTLSCQCGLIYALTNEALPALNSLRLHPQKMLFHAPCKSSWVESSVGLPPRIGSSLGMLIVELEFSFMDTSSLVNQCVPLSCSSHETQVLAPCPAGLCNTHPTRQ
jgi:hypothetical protein